MDIKEFERLVFKGKVKRKYLISRKLGAVKLYCKHCDSYKLFEEFSKDTAKSGLGVKSMCKSCQNIRNKQWYSKNNMAKAKEIYLKRKEKRKGKLENDGS